jgi:glycosyltransferase involved in cell wall biosynthesis
VVSEAIAAGVPVIASAISGNIGLLGDDYPGFYPLANEAALAAQLARAQHEPAWLATLEAAVRAKHHEVDPASEREAIAGLVADLLA